MRRFDPRLIVPGLALLAGFLFVAYCVLWIAAIAFGPD